MNGRIGNLLLFLTLIVSMFFSIQLPVTATENSLQTIIDQSKAGDVINVPAGSYEGPLVIEHPLHLIGEKGTVIQGTSKDHVITILSTSDVTIENITIEGIEKARKSGILVKDSQNIHIDHVRIRNSYHGIYSLSSSDSSFTYNTIEGSIGHFSKKGNGIYLYQTKSMTVDSNMITNVQDGFYIEEDDGVVLTGNGVDASRYGMHFMYSNVGEVRDNTLTENITGMMVMMTDGMDIINNKIEDHLHYKGSGIVLYSVKDSSIEDNLIRNNSTGISLQDSESLNITGNDVLNNQIGLTLQQNKESNLFTQNTMSGNIMQVKSDKSKSILSDQGIGNYWDDYNGLDMDGDGIGDTPYIPTSTYAYLVGSQPVFQYFFEAPAIVLMNQFDHQLVVADDEKVKDMTPAMSAEKYEWNGFTPSYPTIISGIILLGLGFIIRRKAVV